MKGMICAFETIKDESYNTRLFKQCSAQKLLHEQKQRPQIPVAEK